MSKCSELSDYLPSCRNGSAPPVLQFIDPCNKLPSEEEKFDLRVVATTSDDPPENQGQQLTSEVKGEEQPGIWGRQNKLRQVYFTISSKLQPDLCFTCPLVPGDTLIRMMKCESVVGSSEKTSIFEHQQFYLYGQDVHYNTSGL